MAITDRGEQIGSWKIGEGSIWAEIILENGCLSLMSGGAAPGMDFRLPELGGITESGVMVRWERLINCETSILKDGRQKITITVESAGGGLRLTQDVEVFSDHPFIRLSGNVRNTGGQTALLEGCQMLSLSPVCSLPLALFHVEQFSAKYSRDFFRPITARLIEGRAPHEVRMGSFPSMYWEPTSCAWFAMLPDQPGGWFDSPPKDGGGIVCGIEFNGKSRVRAWADGGGAFAVSSIDQLRHRLEPGGVFEIPAAFIGRFYGDWDEAGYITQRFAEAYVHPPMPDGSYPWAQYNSWAYDQDICEEQQLRAIDRCKELGLELAVLDLGWARNIGDWRPDPVKFPNGLRPLAERARSYGMRFGVHMALAQCSLEAPAAMEHPDWLIHREVDYYGAAPLCLGHEPCRQWLIDAVSELVEREGIDYIVQDGEDMVKRCLCESHTHGYGDSNYSNSQYGLDRVIMGVRERCPGLVIENCEDGGCMMTYKMARLYHTSITVDNIDAYSTRQGVFGASYPFSPRYSVRYMQDSPNRYTLYSSIFGGPLILMHRVTDWTEEQMEDTRQAVALYKRLREIVRSGKVLHLLRPENNIPGGGWGWDAIQAVTQDKGRSVLMVYRAQGGENEKTIYPRGLERARLYKVSLSGGGDIGSFTGTELEKNGVVLRLDELGAEAVLFEGI